jgi:hypothetical protein
MLAPDIFDFECCGMVPSSNGCLGSWAKPAAATEVMGCVAMQVAIRRCQQVCLDSLVGIFE